MLALVMLTDQEMLVWLGPLLQTEEEVVGGGRGGGPLIAPAKICTMGQSSHLGEATGGWWLITQV